MLALLILALTSPADPPARPAVVALGSLKATAPAEWKSEKPANRLRSHQFKVASAEEGVADAEVTVYPESSPKVDAKFDEWKATVEPAESKPDSPSVSKRKLELKGATAHILDAHGTWKYRERPRDPTSKEELRPDYRILWVVVVEGEGATHVRFSGPSAVVAKHAKAFEEWLKSAK